MLEEAGLAGEIASGVNGGALGIFGSFLDPSGFSVPDSGAASLVLALAVWLSILAPQWVLLLLGVKHLDRLREAVAGRFGWKLLAVGSWTGAIGLAIIGTVWIRRRTGEMLGGRPRCGDCW